MKQYETGTRGLLTTYLPVGFILQLADFCGAPIDPQKMIVLGHPPSILGERSGHVFLLPNSFKSQLFFSLSKSTKSQLEVNKKSTKIQPKVSTNSTKSQLEVNKKSTKIQPKANKKINQKSSQTSFQVALV